MADTKRIDQHVNVMYADIMIRSTQFGIRLNQPATEYLIKSLLRHGYVKGLIMGSQRTSALINNTER